MGHATDMDATLLIYNEWNQHLIGGLPDDEAVPKRDRKEREAHTDEAPDRSFTQKSNGKPYWPKGVRVPCSGKMVLSDDLARNFKLRLTGQPDRMSYL